MVTFSMRLTVSGFLTSFTLLLLWSHGTLASGLCGTGAPGGCTAGKYCSDGKADKANTFFCTSCDVGTYQDQTEFQGDACKSCPKGTHNPALASESVSKCGNCPKGTYQDDVGKRGCEKCVPGKYSDVEKGASSDCKPCARGKFSSAFQATSYMDCQDCRSGRYSDSVGSTGCLLCPGSKVSLPATTSSTLCTSSCGKGSYTHSSGTCIVCPPGQYTSKAGLSSCTECPAGERPVGGNTGIGWKVCAQASEECTCRGVVRRPDKSNPSKFYARNVNGNVSCTEAVFGINSTGVCDCKLLPDKCDKCDVGKYSTAAGASSCKNCGKGSYAEDLGSKACTECAPGKSQEQVGTGSCQGCVAGKFAQSPSTGCVECPKGTKSSGSLNVECKRCPGGKKTNINAAATLCTICENTKVSPPGSDQCYEKCPRGSTTSNSPASCEICAQGQYQDQEGKGSCTSCAKGKYLEDNAQDFSRHEKEGDCKVCEDGQYSSYSGSHECTDCQSGYFLQDPDAEDHDSKDDCKICDSGTFAQKRAGECKDCAAGKYSTKGSQSCGTAARLDQVDSMQFPGDINLEINEKTNRIVITGCLATAASNSTTVCATSPDAGIRGLYIEWSTDPNYQTDVNSVKNVHMNFANGYFIDTIDTSKYNLVQEKLFIRLAAFKNDTNDRRSRFGSVDPWETTLDCEQNSEYLDVDGAGPGADRGRVVPSKPHTWKCRPCPFGAACKGHVEWKEVQAKYGFWRLVDSIGDTRNTAFVECPVHEACLGSKNEDPRFEIADTARVPPDSIEQCNYELGYKLECSEGKSCPLCSVCREGYYSPFFASCAQCPPLASSVAVCVLSAIVAAGLLAFMTQTAINDANAESIDNSDVMKKILINYFQVISLAANFPFEWPEAFRAYFAASGVASSIGDNMFRLECLFPDYKKATVFYIRVIVYILLPFLVVLALFLYWKIYSILTSTAWSQRTTEQPATVKDKFVVGSVGALYLLYPYSCKMAFSFFRCSPLGDSGSFLTADMTEPCYTGVHLNFVVIGAFQILLYAVGLPAVVWFFLWRNRARLDDYVVKLRWGLFYRGYRRPTYYWEVMVAFRKSLIVLISMMELESVNIQAGVALLSLQMFLVLHMLCKPYIYNKHDNHLHNMEFYGLVSAFLCMWSGMYFGKFANNPKYSTFRITITLFTISVNVLYVCWAMALYIRTLLRDNDNFKDLVEKIPLPVRNFFFGLYSKLNYMFSSVVLMLSRLGQYKGDHVGEHEDWDRVFSHDYGRFYFIHDATATIMWEYYDGAKADETTIEGREWPREGGWRRYWDPSGSNRTRSQLGVSRWYFYHERGGTKWSAAEAGTGETNSTTNPLRKAKISFDAVKKTIKAAIKRSDSSNKTRKRKVSVQLATMGKTSNRALHNETRRPSSHESWSRHYNEEHGAYYFHNELGDIKWEHLHEDDSVASSLPDDGWMLYADDAGHWYFYNAAFDQYRWVYSPDLV